MWYIKIEGKKLIKNSIMKSIPLLIEIEIDFSQKAACCVSASLKGTQHCVEGCWTRRARAIPPGSWNHCKNRCIEFGRSKFECCHKSFRGGGWTALEGQRALHVRGHARKIVKFKTVKRIYASPWLITEKRLARRHLIKCLIKKYCKNSNKQNLHKRARRININGWFTWSPDEVTSLSRVESFKITPGNQY